MILCELLPKLFNTVLILVQLIECDCLIDDIAPGVETTEPLSVSHDKAYVLGSGQPHVNTTTVTQKPNCFLFVFVDAFILASQACSHSVEDNYAFLPSLERVDRLDFAAFGKLKTLEIVNLLAVWAEHAYICTTIVFEHLSENPHYLPLHDIAKRSLELDFAAPRNMNEHERRKGFIDRVLNEFVNDTGTVL